MRTPRHSKKASPRGPGFFFLTGLPRMNPPLASKLRQQATSVSRRIRHAPLLLPGTREASRRSFAGQCATRDGLIPYLTRMRASSHPHPVWAHGFLCLGLTKSPDIGGFLPATKEQMGIGNIGVKTLQRNYFLSICPAPAARKYPLPWPGLVASDSVATPPTVRAANESVQPEERDRIHAEARRLASFSAGPTRSGERMPPDREGMIFVFTGFAKKRTCPFEPHVSRGAGVVRKIWVQLPFSAEILRALRARIQNCCTERPLFEPPNMNSIRVLLPPDHEKWEAAHPRSIRAIRMGLMRAGAIEQRVNRGRHRMSGSPAMRQALHGEGSAGMSLLSRYFLCRPLPAIGVVGCVALIDLF